MTDAATPGEFCPRRGVDEAGGMNPIVVHGGGPQIGELLDRLNIESEFVDGMRVTDEHTMDVVEMVLGASVNKEIVDSIHRNGGRAIGITGKDGQLIQARKLAGDWSREGAKDIGQVGEVASIDTDILTMLIGSDYIPVIAPVRAARTAKPTISMPTWSPANWRGAAGRKADALDQCGRTLDAEGNILTGLNTHQVEELIEQGVIHGGMLPKIQCASRLYKAACQRPHHRRPVAHAALLEIFSTRVSGHNQLSALNDLHPTHALISIVPYPGRSRAHAGQCTYRSG